MHPNTTTHIRLSGIPIPDVTNPLLVPFQFFSHLEIPGVRKVFFNNRHTTVAWDDGTKTTVGCMEGEPFDEYAGFTAAIAKKIYGSSAAVKKLLEEHKVIQPDKRPGKSTGEGSAANA